MSDEIYQSFPLLKIQPDTELPGDLFLFLSGHFVHYKHKGDPVPIQKYNLFIYKKMTHVFIRKDQADDFNNWAQGIEKAQDKKMMDAIGKDNKDLVRLRKQAKGDLFRLFTEEISDSNIIQCLDTTRKIVDKVKDDLVAQHALKKLINYSDAIADHCLNVAYLSVFLAQNLGYTHQIILENIYLGGLLHDFGKTRIDPKYFEDENSTNYDKAMLAHPELGKTTLMARTEVPEEVLRIVAEHHERHDGKGYPNGIKGGKIYDLAKIVSIANAFFDFLAAGEGSFEERKKQAVYLIENDKGHMFDPKKVESSVKLLKTLP